MRENITIEPKVSVIIPTYNGAQFVQEAIFSVLQQEYPNKEIIVCDDASSDNTRECIQEIQHTYDTYNLIQLITNSYNQGIPKNMNIGLEAARGKYIAILDQDDLRLDEKKLDKQVDFLESNSEHKIVGNNAIFDVYGTYKKRSYPKDDNQIRKIILGMCPMQHSSVMYDKTLVRAIGGYCESYKYAMDYKLFLDVMKRSKGANLLDETTYYRRHGNNASITRKKEQRKEALKMREEHKNDFPNSKKTMLAHKTISLLNDILGDNPNYIKLKNELKRIYINIQNSL